MVEVGRFELPSSNHNLEDATCFSYLLDLAVQVSDKQDTQTASFSEFRPVPQKRGHRDYPASGSHIRPPRKPVRGLARLWRAVAAIKQRELTDC